MSAPALRFKQDDGQDFPEWEAKKIGSFVLSHKGGAPLKPADFVKYGNFEVIPKKAISSGGFLRLDETEPTYCSEAFFERNQRSVVDKTFLITTLRDLVPSGPSIGYIVKYINNKKYIGKKQMKSVKKLKPLKGKKNKRHFDIETDWREYTSSSNDLNEDIAKVGKDKFTFEIVHLCDSKFELAYYEAKMQFEHEVLIKDGYYNGIINCRIGKAPRTLLEKLYNKA